MVLATEFCERFDRWLLFMDNEEWMFPRGIGNRVSLSNININTDNCQILMNEDREITCE